jgi:hypothetical protein
MSVCEDLANEIGIQKGIITEADAAVQAINQSLQAIFADMITAAGDVREFEAQIAAIDAAIADLLAEARAETIIVMDEMLTELQARIAEIRSLLDGPPDTPPLPGNEAAVLLAELVELEAVVDVLTTMREEMVNGTAEPILTATEQATMDARLGDRADAGRLLADLHLFQGELEQQETLLQTRKEEQISSQEAADEVIAALQAEAAAAGCELIRREPADLEHDANIDLAEDRVLDSLVGDSEAEGPYALA